MENDLGPPLEDAMMTSEKRIEIGTTWPSYHSPGPITYAWKIICKAELIWWEFNNHLTNFFYQGEYSMMCKIVMLLYLAIKPIKAIFFKEGSKITKSARNFQIFRNSHCIFWTKMQNFNSRKSFNLCYVD